MKTFENVFNDFIEKVGSRSMTPGQSEATRAIFYAGAKSIFLTMDAFKADGIRGAMACAHLMSQWEVEIDQFLKNLAKEQIMRN